MSGAPRVIVVGAGIVGAAVAEALAADGAAVTVIDRGPPGGGATAAGMGHVVAMDHPAPVLALTSLSRRLWGSRVATMPAAVEPARCGTIWIAADDDELEDARRRGKRYEAHGVRAELLGARELYDAEPSLRPGMAGGLFVPGDLVLYAPPAAAALLQEVERHGGEVLVGETVVAMSGGAVRLGNGRTLACDYAVNATGAAAGALSPGFGVRPRRGQLVLTDGEPGLIRHQLVELAYTKSARAYADGPSVAFNVQPRANGKLLIGSSREYGKPTASVDAALLARMLERAAAYVPALTSVRVARAWTGVRAATPDGLPLIGPHPRDPRLILATGHEGLGVTTSLGTARLIADHVAGRPSEIPIEPYLPARLLEDAVVSTSR